jgi:hypothetical protein
VEYINGGAPPYQSYDLKAVAATSYLREDNKAEIRADIWEFSSSDDAYGVFLKDTTEAPRLPGVGTQAASVETTCWVWKGNYFVWIMPGRATATRDEAIAVAKAIAAALPVNDAPLPKLIEKLPPEGRVPANDQYLHKKINFDSFFTTDADVFGLDAAAVNVAMATYDAGGDKRYLFGIFEYRQAAQAAAAAGRFGESLNKSCQPMPPAGPIKMWKNNEGQHFLVEQKGPWLLVVFQAAVVPAAQKTLEQASKNLGEEG